MENIIEEHLNLIIK